MSACSVHTLNAAVYCAIVELLPNISIFTARRNARIASAVLATTIPSVCLFVCLSVRHTPVLCQNDGTYHGALCTVG